MLTIHLLIPLFLQYYLVWAKESLLLSHYSYLSGTGFLFNGLPIICCSPVFFYSSCTSLLLFLFQSSLDIYVMMAARVLRYCWYQDISLRTLLSLNAKKLEVPTVYNCHKVREMLYSEAI